MGKFIKKVVPATTNNITKAIVNLLISEGHSAARINTQGQWDEALGCWRRSGSRRGVFDVVACLRPAGRMLIVDTKKGTDKLRPDQMAYKKEVLAAGGLAYEAATYAEFEHYYFTVVKPTLSHEHIK